MALRPATSTTRHAFSVTAPAGVCLLVRLYVRALSLEMRSTAIAPFQSPTLENSKDSFSLTPNSLLS